MDKTLTGHFLHVLYEYRLRILAASILVCVSNVLLILNPLILRQALFAMDPHDQGDGGSWNLFFHNLFGICFHSIGIWSAFLLTIASISALLKYWMRTIFLSISRQVELKLRDQLFERIQMQSRAFYDRHSVGDILSRLTNDITAYRDMLGPGLMYPMFFITMLIPALIALFYLSPLMAAVSSLPIVIMYAINIVVRRPLFKLSDAVQRSLSDMSRVSHEYFSGIKVVKSYGIEQEISTRFQNICKIFSRLNIRFATYQGMLFPGLVLVTKMVTVLLVIMAGLIVLLNEGKALTLGDFLSFMWIQSYVFSPLLMLAWVIPMYQKGRAAYARLVEIYYEPIEVCEEGSTHSFIDSNSDIVFKNLTFSYPNHIQPALSDINLRIKSGTFLGITGPVASGKTTLFRLLNREYEIPSDTIILGDDDIKCYSLDAIHHDIMTVEQIPFLFSKSIRENIKFGNQRATDQEVAHVAEEADVHRDILTFSHQYDTLVGERGVTLSGGQKQRIAIARIFLANRSLFLLDDLFSAVDAATEKKIFAALKKKFAGKTVLLITHRISILEQMDRVIYLKEGRIVADGSPQDLLEKEGPYKTLADLQHKSEES